MTDLVSMFGLKVSLNLVNVELCLVHICKIKLQQSLGSRIAVHKNTEGRYLVKICTQFFPSVYLELGQIYELYLSLYYLTISHMYPSFLIKFVVFNELFMQKLLNKQKYNWNWLLAWLNDHYHLIIKFSMAIAFFQTHIF